jgi:hypothetical protein
MNILNSQKNRVILAKEMIDTNTFISLMQKYFKEIPFNGKDTFLSRPMLLKSVHLEEYNKLSILLNKVLRAIVLNYFKDERIRKIYQLDNELEHILSLAEGTPYKVGMYRPDFVIDKDGQHKICEIGCRYPINGWMLSYYLNLIVKKLAQSVNPNWQHISEQNAFVSAILKDLDINKTLFYIHHLEKGNEPNDFFNLMRKQGLDVMKISTNELEFKNGRLMIGQQTATQFVLEMDREELKNLKPQILKGLIEADICINDVRSLILVHDKRVLNVLCNEEIICDYISKEAYDFLKSFLIPSYTLDTIQKREELIASTSNWILKKNSGGKGIGSYIKNECTSEVWKSVINNDWQSYMAQKYIDQEVFEIEHNGKKQRINIVGLLLYYNEQSFGPGIFRGSSDSVINVYSGGYILPSVITG